MRVYAYVYMCVRAHACVSDHFNKEFLIIYKEKLSSTFLFRNLSFPFRFLFFSLLSLFDSLYFLFFFKTITDSGVTGSYV